MMAKSIGLLIVRLTKSIRHQETQTQSKVPSRLEVNDLHPAMSRGGTMATSAFLLSIGLFVLPIAARAQPETSDELKSTSGTIEQLTRKVNPAVVEIDVRVWKVDESADQPERAGYLVHDRC